MEPRAPRGDNGEILILNERWAASFKDGRWPDGICSAMSVCGALPGLKQVEIYRHWTSAARRAAHKRGVKIFRFGDVIHRKI